MLLVKGERWVFGWRSIAPPGRGVAFGRLGRPIHEGSRIDQFTAFCKVVVSLQHSVKQESQPVEIEKPITTNMPTVPSLML